MSLRVTSLFLCALLAGCTAQLPIDTRYQASGQNSRVQYVVLHYTSADLERSLQLLTQGEVSSHYLLSAESPIHIYQLVDEQQRAWHAGQSAWQGRTWLNASSIGIEIVNPGYRLDAQGHKQFAAYPEEQIETLIRLLKDIKERHGLDIQIIGHSDIAPQRKVDPGPLFPWHRLAEAGLIDWPEAQAVAEQQAQLQQLPEPLWFQQQLAQHGFAIEATGVWDEQSRNVLTALQMKYRPQRYDGIPDLESAAILIVLNRLKHS